MITFDGLSKEKQQVMLDSGRAGGHSAKHVEEQFNEAQRKIHGGKTPWSSKVGQMEMSDDPITDLFSRDVPDRDIQPAREIFQDEDILDPQRKKKRKRAAQTVLTADFEPPVLGNVGVLGLGS